MGEEREPRSRANKLHRPRAQSDCLAGDPKTCPRCGWPCHSQVQSYYESPWNRWGGICCECAVEAARYYDVKGWPPHPNDAPVS